MNEPTKADLERRASASAAPGGASPSLVEGPPIPATYSRHLAPCCDRARLLKEFCTCAYRSICPVHGSRCNGSH